MYRSLRISLPSDRYLRSWLNGIIARARSELRPLVNFYNRPLPVKRSLLYFEIELEIEFNLLHKAREREPFRLIIATGLDKITVFLYRVWNRKFYKLAWSFITINYKMKMFNWGTSIEPILSDVRVRYVYFLNICFLKIYIYFVN